MHAFYRKAQPKADSAATDFNLPVFIVLMFLALLLIYTGPMIKHTLLEAITEAYHQLKGIPRAGKYEAEQEKKEPIQVQNWAKSKLHQKHLVVGWRDPHAKPKPPPSDRELRLAQQVNDAKKAWQDQPTAQALQNVHNRSANLSVMAGTARGLPV